MGSLTFDFECESCGIEFELVASCEPGQKTAPCPACGGDARQFYAPGAWTTHGTGIFRAGYDEVLGGYVSSNREQAELARRRGLVRKEDVKVQGRREYPDVDQFEKALSELKPSEVLAHKERREKSEWEERSGLREPLAGEYNTDE